MTRFARKEAIAAIQSSAKGTLDALEDLLSWELAEAQSELETARDEIGIWRAQGNAMEIRSLMTAIKNRRM